MENSSKEIHLMEERIKILDIQKLYNIQLKVIFLMV